MFIHIFQNIISSISFDLFHIKWIDKKLIDIHDERMIMTLVGAEPLHKKHVEKKTTIVYKQQQQ